MAAKKRRKKRVSAKPRKRTKARHKRPAAANPRRRAKRRAKRRHHAANPRRRARRARRANPHRAKRRHARVASPRRRRRHHAANPSRRRGKRRHRRNPGIPAWAMAGIAAALGLGSYALATSSAFGLTKRFDPSLETLQRNRYIAGTAFTVGGLLLAAFASPLLGAGLAAGGLVALVGTQLSFKLDPIFQIGSEAAPKSTVTGVFRGDVQQFGAVFQNGQQRLGAVFQGGNQLLSGVDYQRDQMLGGIAYQGDRMGTITRPRFASMQGMLFDADERVESNYFGG